MNYMDSLRHWSGKDICDPPDFYQKEQEELEIPAFLLPENQYRQRGREWREHNDQARIGAAVGAERRKARQARQAEAYRLSSKRSCAIMAVLMTMLLLLVGAVEMGLIL